MPIPPGPSQCLYTKTLFQNNSCESVYDLARLHTTYITIKQGDETASHILLECPALGRRKIPLSGALDNKEVDVNIGLKVLLEERN